MTRFLVLCNPGNRRLALFQEALAREGLPPAEVVSWLEFLRDPGVLDRLPDEPRLFRVDSAGEDEAVERRLLELGWPAARQGPCTSISPSALGDLPSSHGRILCPRQAHLGFERALDQLTEVLARHPRWTCLNPPEDVRELFDKRRTSRRYEALGVPVPEAHREPLEVDTLVDTLRARGWSSAFIKMSASSSASCLAVLRLDAARPSALTTVEQAHDGYFNTLKLRQVSAPAALRELLAFLLGEGSQVEREVPKATLHGAPFDLRVLTIAQEPRFVVVRQNHHRITNLHLGGWRGDLVELRQAVPRPAWEHALASCRLVARCYQSLHVGIDLMFEPDLEHHRVLEANAFGDLLPRVELDGRNVWQWEVRAALGERREPALNHEAT